MIPEKEIREEKFQGANTSLSDMLKDIPMTVTQRDSIQRNIDYMESVFREANNP